MSRWERADVLRRELASRLLERTPAVRDRLTEYETHATALDEIQRAEKTLRHLDRERDDIEAARVQAVSTFLPINQPLYALVLFGIVPALMAGWVAVRPASATAAVVEDLFEILGLDDVVDSLRVAATPSVDGSWTTTWGAATRSSSPGPTGPHARSSSARRATLCSSFTARE